MIMMMKISVDDGTGCVRPKCLLQYIYKYNIPRPINHKVRFSFIHRSTQNKVLSLRSSLVLGTIHRDRIMSIWIFREKLKYNIPIDVGINSPPFLLRLNGHFLGSIDHRRIVTYKRKKKNKNAYLNFSKSHCNSCLGQRDAASQKMQLYCDWLHCLYKG